MYARSDPRRSSPLISRLSRYVDDVNDCVAFNRLSINKSKTELIWLDKPSSSLSSGSSVDRRWMDHTKIHRPWSLCANRCGLVDVLTCGKRHQDLPLSYPVAATHPSIAHIWYSWGALTNSRLDYCIGMLAGSPDSMYKRHQAVLKSAVRLVHQGASAYVSDAMRNDLIWLEYPHIVTQKLCVLVFKCQNIPHLDIWAGSVN